jgi:hypothetical protein
MEDVMDEYEVLEEYYRRIVLLSMVCGGLGVILTFMIQYLDRKQEEAAEEEGNLLISQIKVS